MQSYYGDRMKGRYRGRIVNIIPIEKQEEKDCFLIEAEDDKSNLFWFTMKNIFPCYQTWKKESGLIGDLKENKMYRWTAKENVQLITKNLILETE